MKKLLILLCLTVFTFGYSQDKETPNFNKNEIKGNALFLVLGGIDVSYEHLLNEDSGIGVSLFFNDGENFETTFSLTPYYRAYFGEKPAAGFFVEAFSMISSGKNGSYYTYDYTSTSSYFTEGEKYSGFALGFGVGSKWIHSRGFIFEINAGIGRNLFGTNNTEIVGRGGITLGYRFK